MKTARFFSPRVIAATINASLIAAFMTGCQSANRTPSRRAWLHEAVDYANKTGKLSPADMAVWVRWIETGDNPPPAMLAWARREIVWRAVEPELRTEGARSQWIQEAIEYAHHTGQEAPANFVTWVKWQEGTGKPPPEILVSARQEVARRRELREQLAKQEIERRAAEYEVARLRQIEAQEQLARQEMARQETEKENARLLQNAAQSRIATAPAESTMPSNSETKKPLAARNPQVGPPQHSATPEEIERLRKKIEHWLMYPEDAPGSANHRAIEREKNRQKSGFYDPVLK